MLNDKTFLTTIELIPNPLIVTNGRELLIANKSFLDFFNYSSLYKFVQHHQCVCNLFIKHKGYFSLDLIDKNTLWTDYIYKHNKKALVLILNKKSNPAIFEISINKLDEYENSYLVVLTDITAVIAVKEVQREKKVLETMAYNDPLTKIYNRQMFRKLYQKEFSNLIRYKDNLSMIMLDIDYFKAVNDNYGHDLGDTVLITLVNIIAKNLRKNDIFSRWGGEEFLILMPRTDKTTAYKKAEILRQKIEQYKDNTIPPITISLGVIEVLESDKGQSAFIRVDKALYQAKVKRNDVVLV